MDRHYFVGPVEKAIKENGGSASITQVAKFIWDNYESDIRRSGDALYRWQYDLRWAASILRKRGVMKPEKDSPRGIWELARKI